MNTSAEEFFPLDVSTIPDGEIDAGEIRDHERTFVPAGDITAEELAKALTKEHARHKYADCEVTFKVVGDRVQAIILPKA